MKSIIMLLVCAVAAMAQSPAAKDAIAALRGLNSAVDVGINYREYSQRVTDVKPKVDSVPQDDPLYARLSKIMQLYAITAKAWRGDITNDTGGVMEQAGAEALNNPNIGACTGGPELIDNAKKAQDRIRARTGNVFGQRAATLEWYIGKRIAQNPAVVWTCAKNKLAELDAGAAK